MLPSSQRASQVDRHVGARLRLRRFETGWSQERLADHLGVSFQQIQKYERGSNRISASVLFELSRALEVPVDYFFGGLDELEERADFAKVEAINAFVCSPDGPAIALAFSKVQCAAVRDSILELVSVLSREDG